MAATMPLGRRLRKKTSSWGTDLLGGEGSQGWISRCRCAVTPGFYPGAPVLLDRVFGLLIGASQLRSILI
jgi:hypothetical protein